MLNSFWGKYTKQKNEERHLYFINVSFLILGKFAQRPNMTKVKIISDPAEYFDLLSSDQIKVTDANFINDELIEVHFENVDEFVEADGKTNVVIAAFTTHVQYCQSDTGRESYSRPDKLLRTVNILYDPSLFVSAVGSRVKRLLNRQNIRTVRTVRTIRADCEPIHDPSEIVTRTVVG